MSNAIELQILEPIGTDKEALEFLRKHENPLSFDWVFKDKDGDASLEDFVNRFGNSVYGETAISHLANLYLARNKADKAKVEFEKLKSSKNRILAKEANKALAEIASRKRED